MSTVAQKEGVRQEKEERRKVEKLLAGVEAKRFWEELGLAIRNGVRIA